MREEEDINGRDEEGREEDINGRDGEGRGEKGRAGKRMREVFNKNISYVLQEGE